MTRDILELIANELHLNIVREEVHHIIEEINTGEYDFYAEIDGQEYRFIREDEIWDIYVEGIEEITIESYLGVTHRDLPWWLEIDWEKTAQNCYDADGYGHHFASYDGAEIEWGIDGDNYYIFRTN